MQRQQKIIFGIEIVVLSIIFLMWWFLIDSLTTPSISEKEHDANAPSTYSTTTDIDTLDISELWGEPAQVDQFLGELVDWLLDTEWTKTSTHNAAQWTDITKLCTLFAPICNKTKREWTYSEQDRLNYQWLLIHLIKQVDRRLQTASSLESTVDSIHLSSFQPDRRWSAWHTHVRFNTSKMDSRNEFFQVSVHEMMHIVDLWVIEWRSVFKDSNFTEFGKVTRASNDPSIDFYAISRINENTRKQQQWPEHFVSGYALKNIYEDKAETWTFFLLYNDLFVKKAATNPILRQKYEYFEQLFGGRYMQSGNQFVNTYDSSKNYRDITRLFEDLS
jgi:hypothetical protein